MEDFSKYIKGFYHLSEAWYANASLRGSETVDEVMLGYYAETGGTAGEMGVRWTILGGKQVPQLQVFDDAWAMLASMPELIQEMGKVDDENITPKDFCALLLRLGFTDMTPRRNPYTGSGDRKGTRETMLENSLGTLVDLVAENPDSDEVIEHIDNAKKILGRKASHV